MLEELKPKTLIEMQADHTALSAQAGDKGFQAAVMGEEIKLIHKSMMDLQNQARAMQETQRAKTQPPHFVTEVPSEDLPIEGA